MNQHTYEKRRVQKALNAQGIFIGLYKTASLMKQANVVAIFPKKKHRYDEGEPQRIF